MNQLLAGMFHAHRHVVQLVAIGRGFTDLVPPPLPTEAPPDLPPQRAICGHPEHAKKHKPVWRWNLGMVMPTMTAELVVVQWVLAVHIDMGPDCALPY